MADRRNFALVDPQQQIICLVSAATSAGEWAIAVSSNWILCR